MNRYDPGFIKFREQTVPPDLRNWRNLYGHWLAYQRYLEGLRLNWRVLRFNMERKS